MNKKKLALLALLILFATAVPAFAESQSEIQLKVFLEDIGTFLIRVIGPAVLVIGLAISGISMALGNQLGVSRGILAVIGGALIMMARSILDLIQRITGF